MKDQLDKTGQSSNQLSQLLGDQTIYLRSTQAMGCVGVLYGIFILRVAKLGHKMVKQRSLAWRAFEVLTSLGLPLLATQLLVEQGQKRSFQEYSLQPGSG